MEYVTVCVTPSKSLGGMVATKPCLEQHEGTLEIATGYALATTFGRIATPLGLAMTTFCDSECKRFHALGNQSFVCSSQESLMTGKIFSKEDNSDLKQ
jgi:hypothetical protein